MAAQGSGEGKEQPEQHGLPDWPSPFGRCTEMGVKRRAKVGKGRKRMVSKSGVSGAITSQTIRILGERIGLKIKIHGHCIEVVVKVWVRLPGGGGREWEGWKCVVRRTTAHFISIRPIPSPPPMILFQTRSPL